MSTSKDGKERPLRRRWPSARSVIGQPVVEPLHDTRILAIAAWRWRITSGAGRRERCHGRSYEEYLRFRLEGLVISGEGSVVTGSFEESWVHFLEERGWRFLEHKEPKTSGQI